MNVRIPGDKSISQRALILSGLARGESCIRGLLPGGDPASTASALRNLGVTIPSSSEWIEGIRISGLGLNGFSAPTAPLDLENSGTGARLLLGVLAGQPLEAVVTGDDSLRKRPMARVTDPLSAMGAQFEFIEAHGLLPVRIRGGGLSSFDYHLPVASAQLKSSLLLAGLSGGVPVVLHEPGRSRNHTEGMLQALGVTIESEATAEGWRVSLPSPPEFLNPLDLDVPGDFSSAAFFLLYGLLRGGSEPLVLQGVGLNPTRTGLLPVLRHMGADISVENLRCQEQGEPQGELVVKPSELKGTEVGAGEIPGLIDEVPILAAGAIRAVGRTRITGASELRVKETDRIRAMVENLRALGVEAEELEDGLEIEGTDQPLKGTIRSFGDHRIAMAFGIMGALPGNEIRIDGTEAAGVSFPGFWELLQNVSSEASHPEATEPNRKQGSPPVITLDGPAGSGKSSTAREVARRLGFRHLDSGALYRALTVALLASGIPQEEWPNLSPEELDQFPVHLRPSGDRLLVLLGDRILEDELRTPEVTALVSPLSAFPSVRSWLLEAQRRTGREGALVADGRDMGSVVFQDAEVKIYLTANLTERARRRFLERESREPAPEELTLEANKIQERDTRDSSRSVAPLKKPQGALEVDTSELSFEDQVQVIINRVKTLTDK